MADGTGQALGVGAEAFSGALSSTLNYKVAIAQQQLQVGMQKERLAMDKQRQAMEMETAQQALDRSNIAEQAEKEALKDRIRKGELARESDKLINLSKVIGGFPKSEGVAGGEKGKGAPKKGMKFAALQQGVFGQDINPERLLEAYNLAGKKAPLSLLTQITEMNLTPHEEELRRLGIESEESLIEQRRAAAGASRAKTAGKELKPLTSPEIKLAWDEISAFLGDRFDELSAKELTGEINAFGRQRYGIRWIDYPVPDVKLIQKRFRRDEEIPTFIPENSVVQSLRDKGYSDQEIEEATR